MNTEILKDASLYPLSKILALIVEQEEEMKIRKSELCEMVGSSQGLIQISLEQLQRMNMIELQESKTMYTISWKNERTDIILNPQEYEWTELWGLWLSYKKQEFNFKYKSAISEMSGFSKLKRLANNNIETGRAIIRQSIENGYKGIFAVKEERDSNDFTELKEWITS